MGGGEQGKVGGKHGGRRMRGKSGEEEGKLESREEGHVG